MGAVADQLTWTADVKSAAKRWLRIATYDGDGTEITDTTEDADLERLFNTAVKLADLYVNNPFMENVPRVVFDGVEAADYITINGQSYTARDAGDEEELEFALGSSDSEAAGNFVALVNSTTLAGSWDAIGVEGVAATKQTDVGVYVTFTPRNRESDVEDIVVSSSDDDKLMVRYVRTQITLPDAITQWVFGYMMRRYENPQGLTLVKDASGVTRHYTGMRGEINAMEVDYTDLAPFRLPVGFG